MHKRMIGILVIILVLTINSAALAENIPNVTVSINGKVATNENIKIIINVENIDSFYAGAVKLKYDNKIFKITGFEKGDMISKSGVSVYDVGNKIDDANGIAEYGGFSCMGHVNGFSGTGTFLIIDAQVLKVDNFHIRSIPFLSDPNDNNNLKIQLVNSNIKEVNYNYTGIDFKVNSSNSTAGTISKVDSSGKTTITDNSGTSSSLAANTNVSNSANNSVDTKGQSNVNSSKKLSENNINNSIKSENSSTGGSTLSDKKAENSSINNKYNSDGGKRIIYGAVSIVIAIILAVIFYFRQNLKRFILKKMK